MTHTAGSAVQAVTTDLALLPTLTLELTEAIADSVAASKSENTRRAYVSDWRRFERWCTTHGHPSLPAHPLTVAAYLTDASGIRDQSGEREYAPATLSRWVAAIGHRHRTAGHPAPGATEVVAATLSGIRRTYAAAGERPRKQVAPLLVDDIVNIVAAARRQADGWAAQVLERRDSALLLMGFAGAFRRSELVGLQVGDVTRHRHDGLHVRLRRSKTDQDGRGATRALPRTTSHASCPPCAYTRWLQVVAAFDSAGRPGVIRLLRTAPEFEAHLCQGPLPLVSDLRVPVFRSVRRNGNLSTTALSGAAVHKMIRRRATAAGYDETLVAGLGGHSLRAGFVTQAFRNGADAHAIMRQTGHAGPAMLEVYAREHAPLIGNAVTQIGL
ncbi:MULTISPECIES: site-specific integrase [Rhodococcus]|uniref:Putative integrase n=1 Tax=Rhodococcus ruber TaxID=1830 RepID=A0A098BLC6_9NOCA|nr:putative integrase [Rhodococcus ruber]